jgi:transposase InsO family protein
LIEAEKANYPITRMCALLEVSRSGFYKWRSNRGRGPTPAQQRRAELDAKVATLHKASDGVYGTPRILANLRDDGETVSRKTVAASLRRQGLAGISPRTFAPATTIVDLDAPIPDDLVKRRFDVGALDRVWTSDITYLRTGEGWLYLCAVRDGCSRRVIGWAIDEHMRTDLVEAALAMAVAMRGELAEPGGIPRRSWLPVHQCAAGPLRPRSQPCPFSGPHRGVLGQRSAGIILGHTESRVLRPLLVAHQGSR